LLRSKRETLTRKRKTKRHGCGEELNLRGDETPRKKEAEKRRIVRSRKEKRQI
jgi:hypothetical protein